MDNTQTGDINNRGRRRRRSMADLSRTQQATERLQAMLGSPLEHPLPAPILDPYQFPPAPAGSWSVEQQWDSKCIGSNEEGWAIPGMSAEFEMRYDSADDREEDVTNGPQSPGSARQAATGDDMFLPSCTPRRVTSPSLSEKWLLDAIDNIEINSHGKHSKTALVTPMAQIGTRASLTTLPRPDSQDGTSFSAEGSLPSYQEVKTPEFIAGFNASRVLQGPLIVVDGALRTLSYWDGKTLGRTSDLESSTISSLSTEHSVYHSTHMPYTMKTRHMKELNNPHDHENSLNCRWSISTKALADDADESAEVPRTWDSSLAAPRVPAVTISLAQCENVPMKLSWTHEDPGRSLLQARASQVRGPTRQSFLIDTCVHLDTSPISSMPTCAIGHDLSASPEYWTSGICEDINYWLQADDTAVHVTHLAAVEFKQDPSSAHIACNPVTASLDVSATSIRLFQMKLPSRARELWSPKPLEWLVFDIVWQSIKGVQPFVVVAIPRECITYDSKQSTSALLRLQQPGQVPAAFGNSVDPGSLNEFMEACARGTAEIRMRVVVKD